VRTRNDLSSKPERMQEILIIITWSRLTLETSEIHTQKTYKPTTYYAVQQTYLTP